MIVELRFRRGLASEWVEKNPILAPGEPGFETDTRKIKVGDGVSPWLLLEYLSSSGGPSESLEEHINSPTPHPVYDDVMSLTVLFENGLL